MTADEEGETGTLTLTVDGHLNGHWAAFTLGVGRFADIHSRVIPIDRGEQQRFSDTGHLRHPRTLGSPPEDRGRWIRIGQTSYLELITTLFQLAGRHPDQSRLGRV